MNSSRMDYFSMEERTVLSFSGGRTSGYMLWLSLQANGGVIPPHCQVVFCNTGKEREETLEFVHEIETRWKVPIVWLEYRNQPVKKKRKGKEYDGFHHYFEIVNYETASRKGEPFEQVIYARSFLPNQQMRFCTGELKIRTTGRYLRSLGWCSPYKNFIGIRADEPLRRNKIISCVAEAVRTGSFRLYKTRKKTVSREPNEIPKLPLYDAGVDLSEVMNFWSKQQFDLKLRQDEGNCDFCFLKGGSKLLRLMKDRPEAVDWWIEQEAKGLGRAGSSYGTFLKNRRYEDMRAAATGRIELPVFSFTEKRDWVDCNCTD